MNRLLPKKGVLPLKKTALEEKIQQLSADYSYQKAIASLLLLCMSQLEEEQETAIAYAIHPELLEIKKEVQSYLLELEDILDSETETRMVALEKCMVLKTRLLAIYETIYSYFSTWNLYSTLISNEVAYRKYREESLEGKKVQWDLFHLDCQGFLLDSPTVLEEKRRIGQLLQCIPLRMAKEKYYDLLARSLSLAFSQESEGAINTSLKAFSRFCAPESTPDYGKFFPEIGEWLAAKKSLAPKDLSDEDLNEEYTDFQSVFETLTQIEAYFSTIFHDINSLIILCYLNYTFADLTQEDIAYSDLYHTVCDGISGEFNQIEQEAVLDTLMEQLEIVLEPILDKANAYGEKELSLLEKVSSFETFDEDTQKILLTEEIVRNRFYEDLNDCLFFYEEDENSPIASEDFKKTTFGAFLALVRSQFDQLPIQTRRIAMQLFLSTLPPAFTTEETLALIHDAVDNTKSIEEKLLILDKSGMIFADNGYAIRKPEHTHEHHHEHDHECGCGCHDHHHHH